MLAGSALSVCSLGRYLDALGVLLGAPGELLQPRSLPGFEIDYKKAPSVVTGQPRYNDSLIFLQFRSLPWSLTESEHVPLCLS